MTDDTDTGRSIRISLCFPFLSLEARNGQGHFRVVGTGHDRSSTTKPRTKLS